MKKNNLTIIIAEASTIIRAGIEEQVRKIFDFYFQFIEVAEAERLSESLRLHKPDILLINPSMTGGHSPQQLRDEADNPAMKCIAIVYNVIDPASLRSYDEQIGIYDTPEVLRQKLERFYSKAGKGKDGDEQQALSSREKEIVVCVVKGMTNREIAESLFISTHTVITHRRNIARKLQIHSASGLTVYAIVNKLVELSEISG